jgi:hypothetical protein
LSIGPDGTAAIWQSGLALRDGGLGLDAEGTNLTVIDDGANRDQHWALPTRLDKQFTATLEHLAERGARSIEARGTRGDLARWSRRAF